MKLKISAPAQRDIDRAAAEYFRERQMLGAEFLAEVDYTLMVLNENPRLGHRLDDTYRRIHLRMFPYSLPERYLVPDRATTSKEDCAIGVVDDSAADECETY